MSTNGFWEGNASAITQELQWLAQFLDIRINAYLNSEDDSDKLKAIPLPKHKPEDSAFGHFLAYYQVNIAERLALDLALVSHIKPELLDVFFVKNTTYDRPFTEFGGVKDFDKGFSPTGQTLAFLLAGEDLDSRFVLQDLFSQDHFFARHHILKIEPQEDRPYLEGRLILSGEYIDYFSLGMIRKPEFSLSFPARQVTTDLDWEDLILDTEVLAQIKEIELWIRHSETVLNHFGLHKKLRPGYRCLLHGPPGTGKTLTASLLGKATNREVYKVDLAMVVSKYIGETEKNLSKVFDKAESKGWILFFDEAEALFGKRTETRDAHDRYANQEVAYLLQRVESYDGIIILASNMPANLDEAFARRFESIIHIPMPRPEERLKLWQRGFSAKTPLEDKINLKELAGKHEIAGGTIMNVVRYSTLMAIDRNDYTIRLKDIIDGLRKEYLKVGRTI